MSVDLNKIKQAEVGLRERSVEQVISDVPGLVLVSLLRDYTDDVENLDYIPRTWGNSKQ